jgi:hypothetical protein
VVVIAGAALQRLINRTEAEGGASPARRCLYVGDGSGDLHACKCLGSGDVALARDGPRFSLLPLLQSALETIAVASRPAVVPWSTGDTVLQTVLAFIRPAADAKK